MLVALRSPTVIIAHRCHLDEHSDGRALKSIHMQRHINPSMSTTQRGDAIEGRKRAQTGEESRRQRRQEELSTSTHLWWVSIEI